MGIIIIKHYITEVEKQNRFYEKNRTKSLDIYDRRMYIDNFQFADLKQNTVPYIAVMHFGAWLLFLRKEKDYVAYCCYVHSASIFPASWMNRRSFSCPKPWANTRDWMLAINKWFDFPRGLEYNKIVEIAQNSSRNNTYYELRYHTGDVFHA